MTSADPSDAGNFPAAPQGQSPRERREATIHCIYDPFSPPLNAIISVARRLQEVLIELDGLPEGGQLPFPALAPNYPA